MAGLLRLLAPSSQNATSNADVWQPAHLDVDPILLGTTTWDASLCTPSWGVASLLTADPTCCMLCTQSLPETGLSQSGASASSGSGSSGSGASGSGLVNMDSNAESLKQKFPWCEGTLGVWCGQYHNQVR